MNEWEDTPFFHKFCSFWSCGLRETSRVVDYTTERRKTERKKFVNVSSPLHYLRPTTTEREEIFFKNNNNNNNNIYFSYWSMPPQWNFCISFVVYGVLECTTYLRVYGRLHGERRKTERKKEKCMFPHYITAAGPPQREKNY
jgi:hypothetical protein